MPGALLHFPVSTVMIRSCTCTIRPDAAISEAAEKMCQQGSMAFVVFDGTPLGLITAENMIQALANSQNPETTRVADIMTPPPIPSVSLNAVLDQALAAMVEHHAQAVAVRDGERLAGLITLGRLLPSLAVRGEQVVPVEGG